MLFQQINQLKKILISEDLYQYIINLFKNWNKGIKEKQYKIIKTDDGYDIEPIIQNNREQDKNPAGLSAAVYPTCSPLCMQTSFSGVFPVTA